MSTSKNEYFDLHVSGLGYLGRAREVKPGPGKRFTPFWAVSISALHGPRDSVNYVYFDTTVRGEEASKVIQDLEKAINDENCKVLAGFNLGDLMPETYVKNGETRISLKGRLLRISWVKVDGETVYTAPQPSETDGAKDDDQTSAADSSDQQAASSESGNANQTNPETVSGPVNGQDFSQAPVTDGQGMPSGYSVDIQMPSGS